MTWKLFFSFFALNPIKLGLHIFAKQHHDENWGKDLNFRKIGFNSSGKDLKRFRYALSLCLLI